MNFKTVMLGCLFIAVINSASSQVVNIKFIKLHKEDRKKQILDHSKRFLGILKQNGFNNKDTVNIYFNLPKEYVLVTSNMAASPEILYRSFVVYAMDLYQNIRYSRLSYFKIYVRADENYYYRTNYSTISPFNKKHKMEDKRFVKHLTQNNLSADFFNTAYKNTNIITSTFKLYEKNNTYCYSSGFNFR
jgi:hypothetical protein